MRLYLQVVVSSVNLSVSGVNVVSLSLVVVSERNGSGTAKDHVEHIENEDQGRLRHISDREFPGGARELSKAEETQ